MAGCHIARDKQPELTQLEKFVNSSQPASDVWLATQLNKTPQAICKARSSANLKLLNISTLKAQDAARIDAAEKAEKTFKSSSLPPRVAAHDAKVLAAKVGVAIEQQVANYRSSALRVSEIKKEAADLAAPQQLRANQMFMDRAAGALDVLAELFPGHPAFAATKWIH